VRLPSSEASSAAIGRFQCARPAAERSRGHRHPDAERVRQSNCPLVPRYIEERPRDHPRPALLCDGVSNAGHLLAFYFT
jgi:hypothetical protein